MEVPTTEQLAEEILRFTGWVRENLDAMEVLDFGSAESGIDIRLQVTEDGWQVFRENAFQEEDEGVWASGWLPYGADEDVCAELAEQLLDEVSDELC